MLLVELNGEMGGLVHVGSEQPPSPIWTSFPLGLSLFYYYFIYFIDFD